MIAVSKKYNAIYRGVINLVHWNAGGLVDWSNNDRITFRSQDLDDHHIFPRKFLTKNAEFTSAQVDSVLNRALIPKLTNIKIGAKAPVKYLGELQKKNPTLAEALERHLIPNRLAIGEYDDVYPIFLEDRGRLILDVLQKRVKDTRVEIELAIFPRDEGEP